MLKKLLKSDKYMRHGRISEMLKVTQNSSPDMSVHVNQGTAIFNNQVINIEDQLSMPLNAPAIGHWLVVISVNTLGQLVYTYGVQTTDITGFPIFPDECLHLAMIDIGAADTYITNNQIFDLRMPFNYSVTETKPCQLKCTSQEIHLTEEEKNMVKEYANKYEELAQELAEIKLALQPKKVYTVVTDSGLKYNIRFKDDGTPYYTQVGFSINDNLPVKKVQNYKFDIKHTELNLVSPDNESYIPFTVKLRSLDTHNENCNTTLIMRCVDSRIFSENFMPQYRENEFIIDNLKLDKSGFVEHFSIMFHNYGDHIMKLILLDNDTKEIIDKVSMLIHVTFIEK